MKKRTRAALALCIVLVFGAVLLKGEVKTLAAEETEDGTREYLEEMMEELDFAELDDFFAEREKAVSFSDVVQGLLEDGIFSFDYSLIFQWGKDALFSEISQNRILFIEILLLAVGFSVLNSFTGAFQSAYVSELCFLLIYCVLAVLLLESFLNFHEIAEQTLNQNVEFLKTLLPTLCMTMVFSSGAASSAGFYQLAFLVIFLIQWLFVQVFLPMIHVYVLFELFHHFFPEEKFRNLSELFGDIIRWGMKLAMGVVAGLSVVENLIAPAKDRLVNGAFVRTAALIPGVGNVIGSVNDLFVGAGMVIKNCVGVAALLLLLLIGFLPMAKIACLTFFYKLAAAVAEPITDRRIAGCLKGMAQGGVLYLKLTGYSLLFLFTTIALTVAASAFIR